MRKCITREFVISLVGAFALLVGTSTSAVAQTPRVLRPEDPTPFLDSPDARTLKSTLARILDRMSKASGGSSTFANSDEFLRFMTGTRNDVSQAMTGRTRKTIELGTETLQLLEQIAGGAPEAPMPRLDTDSLEELAKKTSELLASVVSEGEKLPLPSPQAPSKVAPSPQMASRSQGQIPIRPVVPADQVVSLVSVGSVRR